MSISQGHALSAIAFQFAAALQSYQQETEAGLQHPADLDLYLRVSSRMDEMRLYASSLPYVAVPWVEVLIRHFELTHALWRVQQQTADAGSLAEIHKQHQTAVESLQRRLVHSMQSH